MSNVLTITQLADATGVTSATLRAWEERHDFPRPRRLEGGHRRYDAADVEAVRAVVAERASGATLRGAIERVRARPSLLGESVFAALRRDGRLVAQEVSKTTMVALSHALEDELSLRAESGILVGAFQERRFYAQAEQRWTTLARGARLTVVFADFARSRGDGAERPARVSIGAGAPLEREWAVAHLAARSSAVLVGRQLPQGDQRGDPRFEVVWSLDPRGAREVVAHAAHLAARPAPSVAAALTATLETAPPASFDPSFAAALAGRSLARLDRRIASCA
jgi:DICT domain-containing protein/predicted DNA-binding transcriptional regulator AlpA